jgi:hypothetical protein
MLLLSKPLTFTATSNIVSIVDFDSDEEAITNAVTNAIANAVVETIQNFFLYYSFHVILKILLFF